MQIQTGNHRFHVTYCLNIHAGESWQECFSAIERYARRIRDEIRPDGPFGLGLRLGARAAADLAEPRTRGRFREFLGNEDLYVFTVNAFPYGTFHGDRVKEAVYRPDWSETARLDYTIRVAGILSDLLPSGVDGSISTVPGAYRLGPDSADLERILAHLAHAVVALKQIETETGRCICLALEPEPDCIWDRTEHLVRLFEEQLPAAARPVLRADGVRTDAEADRLLRRHLGVCLDTCHALVLFEDPLESLRTLHRHGIRVPKIQVSAAPVADGSPEARAQLEQFAQDPCYLHQTAIRSAAGTVTRYTDLRPALDALAKAPGACELRTHFHIPLVMEAWGAVGSTRTYLGPDFWRLAAACGVAHLEVETYTFDVLPEELRRGGVVRNVAGELHWLLSRLAASA